MCYEGGIREYVSYLNQNKTPVHEQISYMSGAKEDSMAEVALQYNDGYQVSGGLHGVGASVVNALSEWLEVQVHKNGKIHEMKFARG